MKLLSLITALFLLLVLSLHALHFDHDHPEHIYGDGIQAVLHGENKEWFAALPTALVTSLLPLLFVFAATFLRTSFSFAYRDPVRLALARGRIQKRLYE